MKGGNGGVVGSPKMERKTVEKMRRMHMKTLCFKLSSIIPKQLNNNKDSAATQEDLLDHATSYIKHMRDRVERLKRRKEMVMMNNERAKVVGFKLPMVEVRQLESSLEVILIDGISNAFMFHEVIGVLVEEGVDVMNTNFSIANDKIIHTIHSQVCSNLILDASRISQRLRGLMGVGVLKKSEATLCNFQNVSSSPFMFSTAREEVNEPLWATFTL